MFLPLTHTVDVYRLTVSGGKESYGTTPVLTGVDVGVYSSGVDIQALYPGINAFQLYEGYVEENVDLKNGDKLVFGADAWIIRGAPQVYSLPQLSYQRLALEKIVGT